MSILVGGMCSICCHMALVLLVLLLILAFMHLYSTFIAIVFVHSFL